MKKFIILVLNIFIYCFIIVFLVYCQNILYTNILNNNKLNNNTEVLIKSEDIKNDPYRIKNDELFGKLINADNEKVTFVPNTDDNTLFLFSDGPEEIKSLEIQSLLKYYVNDEEHTLPSDKIIDFEFYHYNNASKKETDKNIQVGILVKNTNEFMPVKISIFGFACDTMRIPKTEDSIKFQNEALRIKEDEKIKSIMCATMQYEFFSSVKSDIEQAQTIILKPNETKFLLNVELPFFHRANGRIRIKCDSNDIMARFVSSPIGEEPEIIWKNSEDDIGKCSKGQFCGIVDYTEIEVNVKDMEVGEYVLLGNYDRRRSTRKYLKERSFPRIYNEKNIFYPEDYNEYPEPLYRKEDGKKMFFGNFGVVYNIKFDKKSNSKFIVYPFGHNVAMYSDIVIYKDNWFMTGEIEKKDDSTEYNSYINLTKTDEGFKFVLPGGNCGGIKFKMIEKKKDLTEKLKEFLIFGSLAFYEK